MAGSDTAHPQLSPSDLHGFKCLRKLAELLERLHDAGCARDSAGNRRLHYDQYVLLIALAMFSPCLDSLRMLQAASALDKVRDKLGIARRISLGSFSESCRVFDPQLLEQVACDLWKDLPAGRRPDLFKGLPGKVTLVDGTILRTLAAVTGAMWLRGKAGWRLHLHFDVDTHVPVISEITPPKNSGKADEKNVLRKKLQPDHTYVLDRWYAQFRLFNDMHNAGSHYLCRLRDNSVYQLAQDRPLSDADQAAGVISDQIVLLGQDRKDPDRPDHPVRLICVKTTPHHKRANSKTKTSRHGGSAGPPSDGVLRIATDMLDVPAEIIAFLYAYRWTIEVFIRFFKQVLGNRHLLSTKIEGIRIQVAAAVICCMLMALATGVKPTKRLQLMMHFYLIDLASLAELQREIEQERARQLKAAQKKS